MAALFKSVEYCMLQGDNLLLSCVYSERQIVVILAFSKNVCVRENLLYSSQCFFNYLHGFYRSDFDFICSLLRMAGFLNEFCFHHLGIIISFMIF